MAYNGWKNRQTWNVALWIGNDEGLYLSAKDFKGRAPYVRWVKSMGFENERTPDNIAWMSTRLAYSELNRMMNEL